MSLKEDILSTEQFTPHYIDEGHKVAYGVGFDYALGSAAIKAHEADKLFKEIVDRLRSEWPEEEHPRPWWVCDILNDIGVLTGYWGDQRGNEQEAP